MKRNMFDLIRVEWAKQKGGPAWPCEGENQVVR